MQGYNVRLKLNSKTVLAVTQDDLTVTPTTKESITKDNNGVKDSIVTGQEVTFKIAGILNKKASGQSSNSMDSDDLLEQSLKTGDNAEIPFEYVRDDGAAYQGTAVMTGYSESTPADPDSDATFTADLKVSGAMTKKTGL